MMLPRTRCLTRYTPADVTCMMKTSCRTSSLLFMISRCSFHPARPPSCDCCRIRLAFAAMLSPYALQGCRIRGGHERRQVAAHRRKLSGNDLLGGKTTSMFHKQRPVKKHHLDDDVLQRCAGAPSFCASRKDDTGVDEASAAKPEVTPHTAIRPHEQLQARATVKTRVYHTSYSRT